MKYLCLVSLIGLLAGCASPSKPPLPPGKASRARAYTADLGRPVSLLSVEPLPADLLLSYPILMDETPGQNFVAYGSLGNEVWKYHSNGCRQVQLSYISSVTCAIYFKQTPEPGTNIMTGPSVPLAWDPSPDANVIGYAIYGGTNTGTYQTRYGYGNVTNVVIRNLTPVEWFFIAVAYTAEGVESPPSNEVSAELPLVATGSVIMFPDYMRISGQLPYGTNTIVLPLPKPEPGQPDSGFFELRQF